VTTVQRRALRIVMASLMVAGVFAPATPAASTESCLSFHGAVYLKDFAGGPPVNDVPSTFYVGVEGQNAVATVAPMPGCGDINEGGSSTATYRTENSTATAGADYTHVQETSLPMCDDIDSWQEYCEGVPRSRPINVPLTADGIEDDLAVETLLLRLTAGTRGISGGHPNPVPIYVVDTNGPARASLQPGVDTKVYPHIEAGRIRLPVFLAGTNPPSSVGFSVEGAGAKPATPGADFTCTPTCPGGNGTLPIGSSRFGFVQVNFLRDDIVEGTERLRLSITTPAVASGEPASTVVDILDLSVDESSPVSRLLAPKNGVKYKWGDKRIKQLKTSVAEGPDTIARVEVALQKKVAGGKCAWWNGTKFGKVARNCAKKKWLPMAYRASGDLFFLKIKPLAPTMGTKTKNYSVWTRAADTAGNLETTFTRGRNLATFQVKRK